MKSIQFQYSTLYKEVKCTLEGLNNYYLEVIVDFDKQGIN
jgi:hypothetical protein